MSDWCSRSANKWEHFVNAHHCPAGHHLGCPASLPPAIGDNRPRASSRSQLQKGLWSGNTTPLKWIQLIRSNGYSTSGLSYSPGEDFFFFWTLPSLYYEATKEGGVQLLWSLAEESNIGWKINRPQSSGWKPLLQLLQCLLGGGHHTQGGFGDLSGPMGNHMDCIPLKDLRDKCVLKHHQRRVLIDDYSHGPSFAGCHHSGKVRGTTRKPLLYNCKPLTLPQALRCLDARSQLLVSCVAPRNSLDAGKAKEDTASRAPNPARGMRMRRTSEPSWPRTWKRGPPSNVLLTVYGVTHLGLCPGRGRAVLSLVPIHKLTSPFKTRVEEPLLSRQEKLHHREAPPLWGE